MVGMLVPEKDELRIELDQLLQRRRHPGRFVFAADDVCIEQHDSAAECQSERSIAKPRKNDPVVSYLAGLRIDILHPEEMLARYETTGRRVTGSIVVGEHRRRNRRCDKPARSQPDLTLQLEHKASIGEVQLRWQLTRQRLH